jgi:hypothetical protein
MLPSPKLGLSWNVTSEGRPPGLPSRSRPWIRRRRLGLRPHPSIAQSPCCQQLAILRHADLADLGTWGKRHYGRKRPEQRDEILDRRRKGRTKLCPGLPTISTIPVAGSCGVKTGRLKFVKSSCRKKAGPIGPNRVTASPCRAPGAPLGLASAQCTKSVGLSLATAEARRSMPMVIA